MKKILTLLLLIISVPANAFADPVPEQTQEAAIRNAFEVSYSDAEAAVANALNEKGIGDKLSVIMVGRKSSALYAYDKPLTVEIKGLQIGQLDHRWSASLLFVSNGEVITAIPATGHFDAIIELPVLKKEIRAGDVISNADIEVRDFSATHTRTDTVTDISALIGKTPLHNMSPSRPIRECEITNPAVMKKNALIEMQYSAPGMTIVTSGEALSDGAKGDVINVRNTTSKKIVRAVVIDDRTVNISAPGTQTSQLTGSDHGIN